MPTVPPKMLLIPFFRNVNIVRVSSLVGTYVYIVYIVNKFGIVFSLNVKDYNICPCSNNIGLSYYIYNASVLYQSEYGCVHQTENI